MWDLLVAPLYGFCFLLLAGLALFVAFGGTGRPPKRNPRLRRVFLWLCLFLLAWQVTLFLEVRTALPSLQLWLGRANFAAVVFCAYLALRFVQRVPTSRSTREEDAISSIWLLAATWLLALFTLLTPLVSESERVESGQAVTTYGALFPLYLLHVLGCLAAALAVVLRKRHGAQDRASRGQLTFIGIGMAVTVAIASVTNALLPYAFGDFRFCDIGTLGTLLFVLCVAYAVFVHGLFDPRVLVRETLVYGVLLSFVLGAYSSAVFVVGQYLTESAGKLVQFTVLVIAFSFDPLRRFLEEKADLLLFGEREGGKRASGDSEANGQESASQRWYSSSRGDARNRPVDARSVSSDILVFRAGRAIGVRLTSVPRLLKSRVF